VGEIDSEEWMAILRERYKRGVPRRLRAFWVAYGGEARRNATAAARIAGYKHPNVMGPRLKQKYPKVLSVVDKLFLESVGVKPDELVSHLAEIIRDPEHKDRMRAIEVNAKMHGMLSEKLAIELDRNSLMRQIDERIDQLTRSRALESGTVLALPAPSDQEPDDIT
jgi:hypothetical protein